MAFRWVMTEARDGFALQPELMRRARARVVSLSVGCGRGRSVGGRMRGAERLSLGLAIFCGAVRRCVSKEWRVNSLNPMCEGMEDSIRWILGWVFRDPDERVMIMTLSGPRATC